MGGISWVEDDIKIHLRSPNEAQKAEDDTYRNSEIESADSSVLPSLLRKANSIKVLNEMIQEYKIDFADNLLELGGGMGWLSAYIKAVKPDLKVVLSDVSLEAVTKSRQFEHVFQSKIDEKWVLSAEDTPFPDNSFENLLFFGSFHHVQDPHKTVRECSRLLKKGGKLFLLYEQGCPPFLKPLYDYHVRRGEITENYYSVREYRSFFRNSGISVRVHYYKNFLYRVTAPRMIYYLGLQCVPNPVVGTLFPCSLAILGEKQ